MEQKNDERPEGSHNKVMKDGTLQWFGDLRTKAYQEKHFRIIFKTFHFPN